MDTSLDPKPLRVFMETANGETEIDLASNKEFFKNDLIRYRLTGTFPSAPDFSAVNFVACELYDIKAHGLDFSECDFKDSYVNGAVFSGCKFDGGTFATTFLADTEFRKCTFYNHAAYSCDFRRTRFIECDLTNLLIKSSRFAESSFENCVTSNKICEMSTLFNVTFDGTPIQVETITNNFGLRHDNVINSTIRSDRAREPHESLTTDDLTILLDSPELSSLEGLALEYFLETSLVNGSRLLDESLDLSRWTRIHRNPGSFVELLDKFGEFVVHLYDENQLTLHPILLLHHVTSTLVASVSPGGEHHRIAMSLGGLHLILSRLVEEYRQLLAVISERSSNSVTFLAEGPVDREYFERELSPWLEAGQVRISKLERNSPLSIQLIADHFGYLLPLLGVFLATRTKLEITRLRSSVEKAKKPKGKLRSTQSSSKTNLPAIREEIALPVLSFNSGWTETPNPAYELSLQSLIRDSLVIKLKLQFSTTLARKLRSLLLDLLAESPRERR